MSGPPLWQPVTPRGAIKGLLGTKLHRTRLQSTSPGYLTLQRLDHAPTTEEELSLTVCMVRELQGRPLQFFQDDDGDEGLLEEGRASSVVCRTIASSL